MIEKENTTTLSTLFAEIEALPEKKDKRGRVFTTVGNKERQAGDFYPTPPMGTRALLDREKFEGSILEPACGDGAICKVLYEYGYQDIVARDLFDRGYGSTPHNFLDCRESFDNIVTNPPFVLAVRFLETGLQIARKKFAMLLSLSFLETKTRAALLDASPLRTVYVFGERLRFEGVGTGGGAAICYAWFVWEIGYKGRPEIQWI